VSPNGRYVAIVEGDGKSRLWVQDLEQEQPRLVEGSEGALSPFWSPDSTVIAFATSRKLKRVSIAGGPAIPICDTEGAYVPGGSWSPDGASIVFTAGAASAMYTVAATGGTPRLLLSPRMVEHRPGWIAHPHFLPAEDGTSALLFTYFGSSVSLMALDLKTGRHRIVGSGSSPFYSSTGHLLYRSGTDLWAQSFSPKRAQFSGEPFRVVRNATDPTVTSDGALVYRDLVTEQLVWVDRRGAEAGAIQLPANGVYYPAISPDGRRVAAEAWQQDNLDIWISDTARGARTRVTSHPAIDVVPVWSPDADEVAFSSYRFGNTDIFIRRADAGADEVRLTSAPEDERASDWSRDGQYILYSLLHAKNGTDLWYLKRNAGGAWEPHPFLETSFNEQSAKLSPDGRYVAYLSDESGRDEVYVRDFPSGVHKWPVSSQGGLQLRWSRSGRELFYVEAGTLISVSLRPAPRFEVGRSTRLFSHTALTIWRDPDYDVSPDGQRFIVPQPVGTHPPMIHLVQNWFAEFRHRP
jgi:Tol biopolymer transport system component